MNSEVEDLFDAARRLQNPAQRQAFLWAACHNNPRQRRELEELLALQSDAESLLDPGVACLHPEADQLRQLPPTLLAAVAVEEQVGDRVGRYKLCEKIGEGGCGVVYVADQEEPMRRRVALKVIKAGMDTKSVIARFDAERQALALMDHPNIAKVLDAGATGTGRPYFVMELVRGIKITEFCDQNRLTTGQRLELFVKVCGAVQHAHQKGIIHRDLKPSNILVTLNDGVAVPKIIDFGIAKATEGRLTDLTVYTELNQLIGTPAYMSPEQALMTSVDVDTRSDIYSLGVLLYELLTGKPPFENKELLRLGLDEMRRTIREKEPLRPSTRLSTLSHGELDTAARARGMVPPRLLSLVRGDLDWIVMKCLEKDRARRYATANGLARDIQCHLNNEPIVARPPSRFYEFQKTVRRHRVGFATTAAVILALAAGVIASALETSRATRLRRQAEAEAYTSDVSLAKQAWDEGNLRRATNLLSSHIPKPGEPDLRGFEWRYLWDLFRQESLRTISFADDPVKILASSPAHHFVVASCERTIRLLDPATGVEWGRFPHPNPEAKPVSYAIALASGETNLLATHRGGGVVTLWDLASKTQVLSFQAVFTNLAAMDLSHTAPEAGNFLALSPDGKFLAVASPGTVNSELILWDISATAQRRPRAVWTNEVDGGAFCLAFTSDGRTLISAGSWLANTPRTWDVATGEKRKRFDRLASGNILALAVSPDGSLVAHAGYESRIHVLDFASRTWKCTFDGHSGEVQSLAFSPDSRRLISSGTDGTIRVWDIPSQKAAGLWRDPRILEIHSAVVAPDGDSIFSATSEGIRMWSAVARPPEPVIEVGQEWSDLAISPNGKWLVTSGGPDSEDSIERPAAKVWDIASRRQHTTLAYKEPRPSALAFSPTGGWFAMGTEQKDGVIGLWNTTNWDKADSRLKPILYRTNGFEAGSLCFSPDGKILAVAGLETLSEDASHATNRLAFWEVGSWKRLNLLPGASANPTEWAAAASVDFSHDGRLLAVGHRDGWVRLWDFKQQRLLYETNANGNSGGTGAIVRFSGNDRWLASILWNGHSLALFDLSNLDAGAVLSVRDPADIWRATFAPDNKSLVTADNVGLIKFYNLQTLRVALTLQHSYGPGGLLEFAPDGNHFISLDGKGIMKFWTAPSLEEIDQRRKVP